MVVVVAAVWEGVGEVAADAGVTVREEGEEEAVREEEEAVREEEEEGAVAVEMSMFAASAPSASAVEVVAAPGMGTSSSSSSSNTKSYTGAGRGGCRRPAAISSVSTAAIVTGREGGLTMRGMRVNLKVSYPRWLWE